MVLGYENLSNEQLEQERQKQLARLQTPEYAAARGNVKSAIAGEVQKYVRYIHLEQQSRAVQQQVESGRITQEQASHFLNVSAGNVQEQSRPISSRLNQAQVQAAVQPLPGSNQQSVRSQVLGQRPQVNNPQGVQREFGAGVRTNAPIGLPPIQPESLSFFEGKTTEVSQGFREKAQKALSQPETSFAISTEPVGPTSEKSLARQQGENIFGLGPTSFEEAVNIYQEKTGKQLEAAAINIFATGHGEKNPFFGNIEIAKVKTDQGIVVFERVPEIIPKTEETDYLKAQEQIDLLKGIKRNVPINQQNIFTEQFVREQKQERASEAKTNVLIETGYKQTEQGQRQEYEKKVNELLTQPSKAYSVGEALSLGQVGVSREEKIKSLSGPFQFRVGVRESALEFRKNLPTLGTYAFAGAIAAPFIAGAPIVETLFSVGGTGLSAGFLGVRTYKTAKAIKEGSPAAYQLGKQYFGATTEAGGLAFGVGGLLETPVFQKQTFAPETIIRTGGTVQESLTELPGIRNIKINEEGIATGTITTTGRNIFGFKVEETTQQAPFQVNKVSKGYASEKGVNLIFSKVTAQRLGFDYNTLRSEVLNIGEESIGISKPTLQPVGKPFSLGREAFRYSEQRGIGTFVGRKPLYNEVIPSNIQKLSFPKYAEESRQKSFSQFFEPTNTKRFIFEAEKKKVSVFKKYFTKPEAKEAFNITTKPIVGVEEQFTAEVSKEAFPHTFKLKSKQIKAEGIYDIFTGKPFLNDKFIEQVESFPREKTKFLSQTTKTTLKEPTGPLEIDFNVVSPAYRPSKFKELDVDKIVEQQNEVFKKKERVIGEKSVALSPEGGGKRENAVLPQPYPRQGEGPLVLESQAVNVESKVLFEGIQKRPSGFGKNVFEALRHRYEFEGLRGVKGAGLVSFYGGGNVPKSLNVVSSKSLVEQVPSQKPSSVLVQPVVPIQKQPVKVFQNVERVPKQVTSTEQILNFNQVTPGGNPFGVPEVPPPPIIPKIPVFGFPILGGGSERGKPKKIGGKEASKFKASLGVLAGLTRGIKPTSKALTGFEQRGVTKGNVGAKQQRSVLKAQKQKRLKNRLVKNYVNALPKKAPVFKRKFYVKKSEQGQNNILNQLYKGNR